MTPPFVFGSMASAYLSVEVTRRAYPDAEDYWDGNWVHATVRVRAGAFRGEYDALLRTDEIASFHEQLVPLHAVLNGTARFESMEAWLEVEVVADGRGHFVAKCVARDDAGIGNTLAFELSFDQTELGPVLDSMAAVVEAFPVKGRPNV